MNPDRIGLSALLGDSPQKTLRLNTFLARHWPEQVFSVHGLFKQSSLSEILALPALKSVDTMLASWPHPVQAHLPDVRDEISSIDASTHDAKKLFQNKMGLLFNRVERTSPLLKRWLAAIQKDLGLPKMTDARCMVYATPDGKGTAPHFDQNINFVLQLTGIKKWWLAPNDTVQNPSQRHTLGQEIDPELQTYLDKPFPKKMPASQKSVVLKPGSLLFVPQGYWHSTEAKGEAMSLNFTFNQPSYADLLLAALKTRLLLSPDWRALADGVNANDPDRRELSEQMFEALLAQLVDDLPNWNAKDILGATEG